MHMAAGREKALTVAGTHHKVSKRVPPGSDKLVLSGVFNVNPLHQPLITHDESSLPSIQDFCKREHPFDVTPIIWRERHRVAVFV